MHCITCPPKHLGAICIEVTTELIRRKRQSSSGNCNNPGSVSNGYRRLTNGVASRSRTFSPGQSFRYFCNQGYQLQGNNLLTCSTSGTWSSRPPRCSEIAPSAYCSDPGQIPYGSYRNSAGNSATSQRYSVGDSVIYYCEYGYDLVGSREITCMSSGTWPNTPSCSRVRESPISTRTRPTDSNVNCPDPGSIENGYRRVTNDVPSTSRTFRPGISLRHFCNRGYRLQGSNVLTCLSSGTWSASLPWCSGRDTGNAPPVDRRRVCPYPTVDTNVEIESISPNDGQRGQEFQVRSQVSFRCRSGYQLNGANPIICRNNLQWSNDPPTCTRTRIPSTNGRCLDLGPIQHGGVIAYESNPVSSRQSSRDRTSNTEYHVGTRLRYNCTSGYRLDGERNLICKTPGEWSADKPRCIEDCGLSLLSAGGKITNGKNTTAGQFPWVVFLYINETDSTCGGVLLDHRTVLSAAHCFENAYYCTMYFGKHNRSDEHDDRYVETRRSSEIIVHPEFDIISYNNDIAIVKFSRDVPYTERIQPICMPTPTSTAVNVVTGEMGFLAGWGLNEDRVKSEVLMLANLPVQAPYICTSAFEDKNVALTITPGMYCVGFREHIDEKRIINACKGDSGSPMVFYNNETKRFTVEGLVSHGLNGNCDLPDKYTVLTRVGNYLQWIFQNSGKENK